MNIFLREMKANRKSLIIWCIAILFMVASGMGKYTAYQGAGQSMNDILKDMPRSLKVLLGFGGFDVLKASGFYGVLFLYLLLMATIHAAMLGASVISKEERDKTTEFLLVKPTSRNKIITSKLLAAFTNIIVFNIFTLISSIGIVGKYSKGEEIAGGITKLMIGMFILQLIFLVIGTSVASANKNSKAAVSIATSILLGTFILSMLIDLNGNLDNLKFLTPFKYFDTKSLLYDGGFGVGFVILSLAIIAVLSAATYVFYKKRDMRI
jgi:ABC-2 type transport system permease protein